MKVRDLMTANPETVHPTDVLAVAEEKMQRGRFRRVPVVDAAGHLLGMLADGDLREHVGYLPSTRVTSAMTEKPVTVLADASVMTAAELMVWHKIGGLPVLDADGQLIGIITESDLLRAFAESLPNRQSGAAAERPAAPRTTAVMSQGGAADTSKAVSG